LSAYSIAWQHVGGALADARQTGVDPETLLRALLATMVEHCWRVVSLAYRLIDSK
jgi:hypothetical protein